MKRVELVFIPSPGMGHLVSAIQFSKRLLDRDDRFSVTILSIKRGDVTKADAYIASIAGSDSRLKFIHLPHVDPDPPPQQKPVEKDNTHRIQSQNDLVKEAILNHVLPTTIPLAGLVVDMFNSSMIDVAHELGVPSYVFFTCNAAFLGFMLYLPTRHDQVGIPFRESDPDSVIASYVNPVPSSVLPSFALESSIVVKGHGYLPMVNHGRKFKEVDGIIVNTFYELETHAVNSFLDDKTPPVYTVGPVIDLENKNHSGVNQVKYEEIMKWLDDQPPSSVVFLCFGSWGTFSVPQLKEIALGLERSGHRFLWSIRLRTSNDRFAPLTDSPNLEEILPPGFLERTREVGMICGWAPQVEVLAHNPPPLSLSLSLSKVLAMKKLYRRGSVHPSPPIISDHLSFLPATILTLTAALSPEDREVLAYLLSCSNSSVNFDGRRRTTHHKGGADHPPQFNCNCFRCYTSYWVRWDSSPNRQAIHEIIDAFEAELMAHGKKSGKSRKERRKRGCHNGSAELKRLEASSVKDESSETDSLGGESGNSLHDGAGGGDGEDGLEKGSVRRFVSFIGERIWGVWSQ